jgi:RNA recognition motif-containing protein
MSTRLIVRNIPKHIRESEFKDHFAKKGTYNVTDAQVMYAGTKTR